MPQARTVAVRIRLEAQEYFKGLQQMESATRKSSTSAEAAFARQKAGLEKVGKASLVASAGLTAAFVAAVKASADFEQQMSQVQYVAKASGRQMEALRGAAFATGKAFGLSASQVADAQLELAKAGVSASDIIGGALPGALALASAGQLDVAKATSIASTAMTQFGKAGGDVPHIADLLAASADRSVGSVESVGDALNQSGLVANQFGLSIEDTVGTLTAFSKAGLNGSDAGTSFKTMLLSLASPSKQAQEALDAYNISAYDAQGNFVGITSLAEQLKAGFKGVDQASRDAALSTIFGTDAVRAANVLYKEGADVTLGFGRAQTVAGAAMQASQAKLDNLNGDLQKLAAAFQNDLIGAGSSAQGALRGVAQAATGALDVFASLPQPVQATGLALTGVGAAVAAAGGGFLLLAPKVVAAKAVLGDLGVTNLSLKGGLRGTAAFLTGPYAAAFAVGTAALVAFEARQSALLSASSGTTNALITTSQAQKIYAQAQKDAASSSNFLYDALTTAPKAFGMADAAISSTTKQYSTLQGVLQGLQTPDFGAWLSQLTPAKAAALGPYKDAFTKLDASLTAAGVSSVQAATGFQNLAAPLNGNKAALVQFLDQFPRYRAALVDAASAQGINVTAGTRAEQNTKLLSIVQREASAAAREHAGALRVLAGGADAGKVSVQSLSDAIKNLDGGQLNARDAARGFEQAIDDATAAARKNGRTLDINTQAGRDNQSALDGIARAAQASAQALADSGAEHSAVSKAISRGKKAYIDTAVSMGTERGEAKKLADAIFQIPKSRKTLVTVDGTGKAITAAEALQHKLNTLTDGVYTVNVRFAQTGSVNDSGLVGKGKGPVTRAAGGSITGPGPKGKDSVLAMLAPGEHVLTAREVDRMGGQSAVYAFRSQLMAYAKGGAIGDTKDTVAKFEKQNAYYRAQLVKAKAAEGRLQDVYDGISGKEKDRARKRAAKQQLEKAQKRVADLEKWISDGESREDKARQSTKELREQREDFVSQQRRATADNPIDPLSYVDQLRSMSRDENFSDKQRARFKDAANSYEASLVKQQTELTKATKKLDDFTSAADSMRSSITSSIAGGFQLSAISSIESTGSTFLRDGISYQTTTSGLSADAVDAYYSKGAVSSAGFARDLQTLGQRGLDGRLLAEIAGYGVEQGAPMAKALLSATSGQIGSINAGYTAIQSNAAAAAGTVTDVNYRALIDSAQANADRITAQIAADGAKLRKLIASAFGLTGYAIGTNNARPGWHLVGEQGPELANFGRGGGTVLTAPTTAQMIAGSRTTSMTVTGPQTVTIIDADGTLIGSFRTAARSVARQEIHSNAAQGAVAWVGGAA